MKNSSVRGATNRSRRAAATPRTWLAAWPWLVPGALLVAATLVCYYPALGADFVWDDDKMLTQNPFVRLPAGLYYIWCTTLLPDYYPLTSTSFWLEWRLWGLHAGGYHLTNILLHAASACLLWQVLKRLRVPGAWLAALVFAVHPINVQSVAWIAERKNTLCMFFFLLSILWYLRSEDEGAPGISPKSEILSPKEIRKPKSELRDAESEAERFNSILRNPQSAFRASKWYGLSLVAFLCALLSKTAVVLLPVLLLLLAWWHHGRVARRDWLKVAPFLALSLALGLTTVWFQKYRAIAGEVIRAEDLPTRTAAAAQAVWFYTSKLLWPGELVFVYRQWNINAYAVPAWLPLAAGLLGLVALWALRRRWTRTPLFAALCYLLMLLPVLGFVDVYFHRYSLVADHYAYFAAPALIALGVGAGAAGFRRLRSPAKWALPVAAAVSVGWLAAATWRQAGVYHDPGTLWADTLAKNPACWLAHNSLGSALAQAGRSAEARAHFEQGLAIKPDSAELLNNVGSVLLDQGKPAEAIPFLQKTLQIAPRSAMAYYNLGNALDQLNQPREAEAHYRRALELDPYHAEAHSNLGCLLYAAGKKQEAIAAFTRAISLKPNYADALNNLGLILLELGRLPEAEPLLREAVRLRPDSPDTQFNLANALLFRGRPGEAASAYRRVLALDPQHALAHCRLGAALGQTGDPDAALGHLRRAVQLQTDSPEALAALGFALATAAGDKDRDGAEALRLATRAVELTSRTNAAALDALAAAYAETASFPEAVRTAAAAAALARADGDTTRAAQIQQRQQLYEAGQPCRP